MRENKSVGQVKAEKKQKTISSFVYVIVFLLRYVL